MSFTTPICPPGLVYLIHATHEELMSQLQAWKTALPGTPNEEGLYPIFVNPDELDSWKSEQCDSTR